MCKEKELPEHSRSSGLKNERSNQGWDIFFSTGSWKFDTHTCLVFY
jgi:hypothetical protein